MFIVHVDTTNAAFAEDPNGELARILRHVAERVEAGAPSGVIRDTNGNRVGRWTVSEPRDML